MKDTIILVIQIIFALSSPYVIYCAFKVAQEESAKANFDEDTGAGCMFVLICMLCLVNLVSLSNKFL